MKECYLILGGGGFLGRALASRLLRTGGSVRSFSRRSYPDLEALGVECFRGDILDVAALERACRGCTTLFHTVAICEIVKPARLYHDVNVQGTRNVLEACRRCGVSRLVYTSTPSVVIGREDIVMGNEELLYAKSFLSPYPETKMMAEKLVLAANSAEFRTCALRPHLMWGAGEPHIIPLILQEADAGRLKIVGDGRNQVSLTHVLNAAEAHWQAAEELAGAGRCAGKPYFVNDVEPVFLWEWINSLLEGCGRPRVTRHVSRALFELLGGLEELLHALPGLGAPRLNRFTAHQLGHSHSFSCERAMREFGYSPVISPEEGMRELLASLRQR